MSRWGPLSSADLPFSQSISPGVVNAYPESPRGCCCARDVSATCSGPNVVFSDRPRGVFVAASGAVRRRPRARRCLTAARFVQGSRWALASAVSRDDRDDAPEQDDQARQAAYSASFAGRGRLARLRAVGVITQAINLATYLLRHLPIGARETAVLAVRLVGRDGGSGIGLASGPTCLVCRVLSPGR